MLMHTAQKTSKRYGDYIAVTVKEERGRMLVENVLEKVRYFAVRFPGWVVTYRVTEDLGLWSYDVVELTRARV